MRVQQHKERTSLFVKGWRGGESKAKGRTNKCALPLLHPSPPTHAAAMYLVGHITFLRGLVIHTPQALSQHPPQSITSSRM